MSGHRQAALALYSLADSDRRAILAELPERDRDTLRAYLAELTELGFDRAANSGAVAALAPVGGAGAASDVLLRAEPAAMAALLRHEPAAFVAALLSFEPWPWAPAFLELHTPLRRAQIADAGRAGAIAAPACRAFVVDALAAALRTMPAPAPAAPQHSVPRRFSRMLQWTR
jgi:hypothetical protein